MDLTDFVKTYLLPKGTEHVEVLNPDSVYMTGNEGFALVSIYKGDKVTELRFSVENGALRIQVDENADWMA